MKSFIVAALLLTGLIATAPASGQSFNCRYAKTASENLICSNPDLARLDEEMATAFYSLSQADQRGERSRQSRFLAARDRCGYDLACAANAYQRRINSLYELADSF